MVAADTQPALTTARANHDAARVALQSSIDAYDADPSDEACDRMMQAQADYDAAFVAWSQAERGETSDIQAALLAATAPRGSAELLTEWEAEADEHKHAQIAHSEPQTGEQEEWWDEGYRCGLLSACVDLRELLPSSPSDDDKAIQDEARAISPVAVLDSEDVELLTLIRDRGPSLYGQAAADAHERVLRLKQAGLLRWYGGAIIGHWELTSAAHKAMGERVAAALGMTGEVA